MLQCNCQQIDLCNYVNLRWMMFDFISSVVPRQPAITQNSPSSGTVVDQTSVIIQCSSPSSMTSPRYQFSIDGVEQNLQSSDLLTISASTAVSKTYACKVSNDGTAFSSLSADFQLRGKLIDG